MSESTVASPAISAWVHAYRYPCVSGCGRRTGHKSGRCDECRTRTCRGCPRRFVARSEATRYCSDCVRDGEVLKSRRV